MACRVIETSFGTKQATVDKIDEINRLKGKKRQWLMYRYWLKVYENALRECPVDTGALRASIRISKSEGFGEKYEKAVHIKGADESWDYYIIAGGGGIINPKHKKEVDYALAVHDGFVDKGGMWHPGNPFLERAFNQAEEELNKSLNEYLDWIEKKWAEGALKEAPPDAYQLSLRMQGK